MKRGPHAPDVCVCVCVCCGERERPTRNALHKLKRVLRAARKVLLLSLSLSHKHAQRTLPPHSRQTSWLAALREVVA